MGKDYIPQDAGVRKVLADAKLRRCLNELTGLVRGLLADRQLVPEEVYHLNLWLSQNPEIAGQWPGDVVASRVRAALADGHLSAEELEHLKQTLEDLIGGNVEQAGGAAAGPTTLPCDDSAEVIHAGRNFCLTGDFVFGPRRRVQQVIELAGGTVLPGVRKDLHYLVIGAHGSDAYVAESFGTKIEKAVKYQREGAPLVIVSERRWFSFLA